MYQNDKFEPGGGREAGQAQGRRRPRPRARAIAPGARARVCSATTADAIQLARIELHDFSQRGSRARSGALAVGGRQGSGGDPIPGRCLYHRRTCIRRIRTAPSDRARMGELYRKLHGSEDRPGRPDPEGLRRHFGAAGGAARRTAAIWIRTRSSRIRCIHPHRPGRRQARALFAARQSGGARFLGHLVRSLPRAASALRTGEGEIQGPRRRGVSCHRHRRGSQPGEAVPRIASSGARRSISRTACRACCRSLPFPPPSSSARRAKSSAA